MISVWWPGKIMRFLEIATSPTEWQDVPDRALLNDGLIEHSTELGHYTSSERGRELILMWENTPLPEQVWVDPRDKK